MWIVRLALRRPYTFVVVSTLIAVLGVLSIVTMPTDIFPDIKIPVISVVWTYGGLSPTEMQDRITTVVERAMTTAVSNIEHLESQSLRGVSVIKVYFQPGADVNAAVAQVTAICQTLLRPLPTGINPPLILQYNASGVPVVMLSLGSDKLSDQEISDLGSNFIRTQLVTVPGVAVPPPYGGKTRVVNVDVDPDALFARGLSPDEVNAAINTQNVVRSPGTIKMGPLEYDVAINSSPELLAQLNDIPLKYVNGAMVYVRDVAFVHDGYSPQTNLVRRDGRHSVLLPVLTSGSASTLSVVAGVRALMPKIQAGLPKSLSVDFLFDQSVFVRASISGVLREGAIAACLTALMILLFLHSWRSTLIVATSIPLSLLASIGVLHALGQTLNVMTLGGMALAVGILVDDATVEIENNHRHMELGTPLRQAILDGAAEVASPAFVSTLSICIVFVPVFFLTGPAAYLFAPLAMAVIFAMLASYFLSRTLVPTMVLYLLPKELPLYQKEHAPGGGPIWKLHKQFDRVFEWFRGHYRGLLDRALSYRFLTVALMLCFAGGSLALFPRVGQDFFPEVDAGQIRMHVRAPAGTRIEETEKIFGQVEDVIREVIPESERQTILDNMGLTQSFTVMAYVDNGTVSNSDGELLIALKPGHRPTREYIAKLREELPKRFPGCTFYFEPADITGQILNAGLPAPINVQVVGVNREANLEVAKKLRREMAKIPGAADVHLHQITDGPELRLDVDRIMASELNLTQQDVSGSVLVSLSSTSQIAPNFWVNPMNRVNYRVAVQTPPYRIDSVDTLLNTPIVKPGQQPQLLANLADLRRSTSALNINHRDTQPVYEVNANVQGRDLGGVVTDVQKVVDQVSPELPRGSTIVIRGQAESMNTSFSGLAYALAFAVLLVHL